MTNSDIRKSIKTIEQANLDEAGGILDKALAALKNKGAKGRIAVEKERKQILDGWEEYAGAHGLKNKDAEGFKKFLAYWNFDTNEINNIVSGGLFKLKDVLLTAAKIQWESGKGVTGEERGGPFKKDVSTSGDYKAIMAFYTGELKGNATALHAEFKSVTNIDNISADPLESLGYAFMKANKKG